MTFYTRLNDVDYEHKLTEVVELIAYAIGPELERRRRLADEKSRANLKKSSNYRGAP